MKNLIIDSPLNGTTAFEFGGGKWKLKSVGKIILSR